jgi:(1->4)-alpha-D-glucan 1-alpha-D-glucosylmutase
MSVAVNPHPVELVESLYREMLAALLRLGHVPGATYRLQLNADFSFFDAARVVPYLAALGATDLYASPYLKAVPGSRHGYDVVDPNALNPELGGREGFEALVRALGAQGMGQVLDFVPNHMAIGAFNPLWMDVLENGPSSVWAHVFDIDWNPIKEELANKVLLPILGDQYGAVLERGELKLAFESGGFHLDYFEHRFPVTPRQYPQILNHRLEQLREVLPAGDVHFEDYLSIASALSRLPPRSEREPERIAERHREKEVVKRRILALCEACPKVRAFIEENVRIFNGTPGDPRSFDRLDTLLREQAYRLAYWRVAAEEINYRRFFDINELAAIRMEDPRVMQLSHALVFRLIGEGKLNGLRIDHPDGLFLPADYFARLQEAYALTVAKALFLERHGLARGAELGPPLDAEWAAAAPLLRARVREEAARGPGSPLFRPLYVVVEKILAHDERMPGSWAVHGTTGYEVMARLNGLFVDERNARALDEIFARFTGLRLDYAELVYQKRRQTMADSLSSEIQVLSRQLNRIAERDRRTRDFTLDSLRRALVEVLACFPVYRTYLSALGQPDEHDRRFVEAAVRRARRKNPMVNASLFHFIRDLLLGPGDEAASEEVRAERLQFVLKLQQVSAPVMAKSVEDTVFYVYNRLVSLNEVGGEPDVFGAGLEAFHAVNRERLERWPGALTATSTHDTKRSEDVRVRIDVLSELPGEWRRRLATWSRLNRRSRVRVGEALAPDRNEELLLYQTLIGAWPFEALEPYRPAEGRSASGPLVRGLEPYRPAEGRSASGPLVRALDPEALAAFCARIQEYMQKAIKEAKVNTSWMNPDDEWDRAVQRFVAALLDPARSERFWRDFLPFQRKVARAGALNSLSQVALKVASPGVPDFYQGSELWDFSLVDPDNRRPVDWERHVEALAWLDARLEEGERDALARELFEHFEDGRIKLYVTSQALRARRSFSALFSQGEYLALPASGERARHVVAFARRRGEESAVVLAPRLVSPMIERTADLAGGEAWGDTQVELLGTRGGERYVELFTGAPVEIRRENGRARLRLRDVFRGFPVVLAIEEWMAKELWGVPARRPAFIAEPAEIGAPAGVRARDSRVTYSTHPGWL